MTKASRTLTIIQPNPKAIPKPLRYYDPDLQDSLNVEPFDPERRQRACIKAKQLYAAYLRQLELLKPRLSKATFGRFRDERRPLFDSDLLEFTVGDCVGYRDKRGKLHPRTTVQASFLDFEEKTLHLLKYDEVESLNLNIPTERWYERFRRRIDSLLADELTSVSPTLMQHALLFASGSTITLAFRKVSWKVERIKR